MILIIKLIYFHNCNKIPENNYQFRWLHSICQPDVKYLLTKLARKKLNINFLLYFIKK